MCKPNSEQPIKLDLERWDRWVQWIEKVRIDLKSALVDRTVFRGFSDIVSDNRAWIAEHYGGRFCEFVARAYVARVAAAVRRHSRSHKDAITLTGILEQMERCAPQLTFDFFLERFPGGGEAHFTQSATFKYVSQDGRVASEALIRQDIDELQRLTTKVEAFVDKELAPSDDLPPRRAKVMREARDTDVWRFTTPQQVWASFDRLRPYLGRRPGF